MEKIKILLLGLGNINNAGDEILIETTEWLVKKSGGKNNKKTIDACI